MNQISSEFIAFRKYVVPCVFALSTIWMLLTIRDALDVIYLSVGNLVFWSFWFSFAASAQTVYEDSIGLIIEKRKGKERIGFDQIRSIYESGSCSWKVARVFLKSGREFYFVPSDMTTFDTSPTVVRLQKKISEAQPVVIANT